MLMTAMTLATVAGVGLDIYGKSKQAKSQQRAAQAQAAAQRRKAGELLRRTDLSLLDLEKEGDEFAGDQMLALASNNVSLDSTSSYFILADTFNQVTQDRARMIDEARFEAQEIETGALDFERQGRDAKRAGDIGMAASAISGAATLSGDLFGRKT